MKRSQLPKHLQAQVTKEESPHEKLLELQMRHDHVEPWQREFHFCPGRKYRADFGWPLHKLLVEIEGLTYEGGRHQRKDGFEADAVKYQIAAELGYEVLRFTPTQVRDGSALQTIHRVLARRQVAAIAGQ